MRGDKILVFFNPAVGNNVFRFNSAKVTFDTYKIKIAQELHYPGSGDPSRFVMK